MIVGYIQGSAAARMPRVSLSEMEFYHYKIQLDV